MDQNLKYKHLFEGFITGSSFVINIYGATMISQTQSTFKRAGFSFPSPSGAIFSFHGFIQSLVDSRQIILSSHIMGQRLLPKVQRIAQLSSSVSDGHGAMLKPCRSEQGSPMLGFEKHFVRRKCKFPSGFRFSYSSFKHVHNCGVKMESSNFFYFLFFKKLEVFRTDTCSKAHLLSKNQEITELDRSLSMCGVE